MRGNFPFTDYDFWAYIASGFVFLFALDHVEGLFATACAYAIGHLLSGVASALLERRLVGGYLGRPLATLLGVNQGPRWFRWVYPSFYEPLPVETQKLVFDKATLRNITTPGEAMFWEAFEATRENKVAMDRMTNFLNQYGMCRNLAATALICSAMLVWHAYAAGGGDDYWLAGAAAVLGCGMFFRYLKFYRHYSVEVLTCYAHAK
jgi:hypothetical protein